MPIGAGKRRNVPDSVFLWITQAGLAYSTFQRRDSASFQRIQLGLKARRGIHDAVDEYGAIIQQDMEEGTPDLG